MRGLCDGLRELIRTNAARDSPQCAVTSLKRAKDERQHENKNKNARPWVVSGVGGRALDENQPGSRESNLGAFEAVVTTDVMLTKTGTPGSCVLEGVPLAFPTKTRETIDKRTSPERRRARRRRGAPWKARPPSRSSR
jgi:hypothetical protein